MNIYYINDLHLDQRLNLKKNKNEKINQLISDIMIDCDEKDAKNSLLIIAGDFSNYSSHALLFLKQISQFFKQVAIVFGNHDYYLIDAHHASKYQFDSEYKINELYQSLKEINNVHVLGEQFDNILNFNGLKIGGTTLFSNPYTDEKSTHFYDTYMADSKYIHFNHSIVEQNKKEIDYYHRLKNENLNIFVSHFPIIMTQSHAMHGRLNDGSHSSFKTEVNELIAPIYLFGHVHERSQYKIDDVCFYTNCAGYKGEFSTAKIKLIQL